MPHPVKQQLSLIAVAVEEIESTQAEEVAEARPRRLQANGSVGRYTLHLTASVSNYLIVFLPLVSNCF